MDEDGRTSLEPKEIEATFRIAFELRKVLGESTLGGNGRGRSGGRVHEARGE